MRIGPVEFASPWLLTGLLAAAIPPVLHLLSSRRAREAPFPTLRFLQLSAQRTARRRRVRHWLLLLLRSALLAVLAIAVAQLIVHASGATFGGGSHAAVLILDNSGSMGTVAGSLSRLDRAVVATSELLDGSDPPATGAFIATCESARPTHLSTDPDQLTDDIANCGISERRANTTDCIRHAMELLADRSESDKRIYVFSDLQRSSFADVAEAINSDDHPSIRLLIVDVAGDRPTNVGITDLAVRGRRVVDQTITFAAQLRNAAATDAIVTVRLEIDGKTAGTPKTVTVRGSESFDAASALVQFAHALDSAGTYTGRVIIDEADDLAADNQRPFILTVADRARALVIGGATQAAAHDDAAKVLLYALDPRTNPATRWSVRPHFIRSQSLRPADLERIDAVLCGDVASFRVNQVAALSDFVGRGGRLVLFAGADTDVDAYNRRLSDMLPGRLVGPVGRVGPDAPAVALGEIAEDHPYFKHLNPSASELQQVLTQRYVRIELPDDRDSTGIEVLMRLANGDPLLLSRSVGSGKVILCTTTASLQWTNLPSVGLSLFVPMLERICLEAVEPEVGETDDPFDGTEFDLRPMEAGLLREHTGEDRTFIGESIADVHGAAADRAAGLSLSEPLLVVVIVLLVLETRLANRRRTSTELQ